MVSAGTPRAGGVEGRWRWGPAPGQGGMGGGGDMVGRFGQGKGCEGEGENWKKPGNGFFG